MSYAQKRLYYKFINSFNMYIKKQNIFICFPEPSIDLETDALRRRFASRRGSAELADGVIRQSIGRISSLHRRQRRPQAHQRRKSQSHRRTTASLSSESSSISGLTFYPNFSVFQDVCV